MQEKSNLKLIIIVIFCVVVFVGLGLGALSLIRSATGIGGSDTVATTPTPTPTISTTPTPPLLADEYISSKNKIIGTKILQNCSDIPIKSENEAVCNSLNDIKSILENVNSEKLSTSFKDFNDKCLKLIDNGDNRKTLEKTCPSLIKQVNKVAETEPTKTSTNSDLTILNGNVENLKQQVENLKQQLDGVSKDNLNEINNSVAILKWLLLFLFILIGSLIGYQIWNQTKLLKKLEEVQGLIGLPDNRKTLANIVSEAKDNIQKQIIEGKDNIQNQIISLSEIISSSNLNVKEQIDELNRRNLEEARKREEEQNRNNIITIPIDNSYTQSNEQQSSNIESEYEALKGLVSDIQNRFAVKPELTKHPYSKTLKPISSSSETVTFFSITIEKIRGIRTYAIPVATRINSSAESTHLTEFYTLHESNTGDLNGKLNIKEPAEIKWNEDIKGWELVNKGEINIVS